MEGFQYSQPDSNLEQARDEANAWMARFAPLVLQTDEPPTESMLRQQIATIESLQSTARTVQTRLASVATTQDLELKSTLERAVGQLQSIEDDVRRQLGKVRPGDPAGIADLDAVNAKLSERLARQEIGAPTSLEVPAVLEMKVSPGNWAAAGGIGLFGFGWTSFTTFHAVLMIGGMSKAFGWGALALLGFYSIFFAVGFSMIYAAINSASTESFTLDGDQLVIRKKLGGWVREKRYTIDPSVKADVESVSNTVRMGNQKGPVPMIALQDKDGRQVTFGQNATPAQRKIICDRINAYIATVR